MLLHVHLPSHIPFLLSECHSKPLSFLFSHLARMRSFAPFTKSLPSSPLWEFALVATVLCRSLHLHFCCGLNTSKGYFPTLRLWVCLCAWLWPIAWKHTDVASIQSPFKKLLPSLWEEHAWTCPSRSMRNSWSRTCLWAADPAASSFHQLTLRGPTDMWGKCLFYATDSLWWPDRWYIVATNEPIRPRGLLSLLCLPIASSHGWFISKTTEKANWHTALPTLQPSTSQISQSG